MTGLTPGGNPYVERVIAVDPGKLTGACLMERVRAAEHTIRLVESAELGPAEFIPWFRETYSLWEDKPALSCGPPLRVVCESFKITARTGELSSEAGWALKQIGALEQACRDLGYPVEAIQFYRPDQKKVFPNPRLKKLGLWHVGGKGHALDAIRHGSLYLAHTGQFPAAD